MSKNPPDTDKVRRPAAEVIDQRQQQIDPARHHTVDPNARLEDDTKQPGQVPKDDAR